MTLLHLLKLVDQAIVIGSIGDAEIRSFPEISPRWLLLTGGEICLLTVHYLLHFFLVDAGEIAERGVDGVYGCFLVESQWKGAIVD